MSLTWQTSAYISPAEMLHYYCTMHVMAKCQSICVSQTTVHDHVIIVVCHPKHATFLSHKI